MTQWSSTSLKTLARHVVLAAFVALGATLGLSGCRFGNYELDPPGPGVIQGTYQTQMASQIEVCAAKSLTSGGSQQTCNPASNSEADPLFLQTMTVPVVLLEYDPNSGLFLLESPTVSNPTAYTNQAFIVESDGQGDLQTPAQIQYGTVALMPDMHPTCILNLNYTGSGTYNQPLQGRIAMTFDMNYSFNQGGDCSQLANCYASTYSTSGACDANDHTTVTTELAPYIGAGSMAATDIPNLISLDSVVSYQ